MEEPKRRSRKPTALDKFDAEELDEKLPGGRPRVKAAQISIQDQIYELAKIHCSLPEIEAVTGISKSTLKRSFGPIIAKGREEGKTILRNSLWDMAKAGHFGAMVWLSKQHLGMTDKLDTKNDTKTESKDVITYKAVWGGNGEPISLPSSMSDDDDIEEEEAE